MLAIFRRDLMTYFNSATAWILSAVYLFITGLIFWKMTSAFSERCMMAGANPMMGGGGVPNVMNELIVPYVWWMGFLMMFILPMLTMRLIAEERRIGTLELLFTYPLSDAQIVGGKFLAALCVALFMLAFGFTSVLALSQKVQLEWNLVAMGFGGLILLASAFISFGLWTSSLTGSQMVAAVLTYGGLMMMWLVQVLDELIQPIKDQLGGLSIMEHLENMVRGNATSHDIVYYIAWIGLFLFLTCRVLESRKWSS